MNDMKKYKVCDVYEEFETIGYSDTIEGCKAIARKRVKETDGECHVVRFTLDSEKPRYKWSSERTVIL